MLKLKHSLLAFVGVLAMIGIVTLLAPSGTRGQRPAPPTANVLVVNTEENPVAVTGTVSIEGVVQTQPAAPSEAFSVVLGDSFSGNRRVSGPDPAGTGYAITSLTVANNRDSPAQGFLLARYGSTSDCQSFIGDFTLVLGPQVVVPARDTVHLSFPQPFVLPAQPGAAACLLTSEGVNTVITVVGYRF